MSTLKVLNPEARILLTPEFLLSPNPVDASKFIGEFARPVEIDTAVELIRLAMHRFDENSVESDSWLAPRVHLALRLTRREAAELGIWEYLALIEVPQYVHWRWPGKDKGTTRKRYCGRLDEQAIARLWWGAELTRNGKNYSPTVDAFKNQDVPNTWFRLNLFHHKPAIQAAIRFTLGKSSDETNRIAKVIDMALKTTSLDALARSDNSDSATIEEWIAEGAPPITELTNQTLPAGPDEPAIPENHIQSVLSFFERISALVPPTNPRTALPRRKVHAS